MHKHAWPDGGWKGVRDILPEGGELVHEGLLGPQAGVEENVIEREERVRGGEDRDDACAG